MAAGIRAAGLLNLRQAFKRSQGTAFDRFLAKAHQQIADQVVAAAKPGIAQVSSSTASATTAVKSASGAKVRVDRNEVPYAGGVIFGAVQNIRRVGPSGRRFRGYNQFRPWHAGPYHIFPELDPLRDQIADDYIQAIDDFFSSQGVP